MTTGSYNADDLVGVRSVLGGEVLNLTWLVDALEMALRERKLWPLRMYLRLKGA